MTEKQKDYVIRRCNLRENNNRMWQFLEKRLLT